MRPQNTVLIECNVILWFWILWHIFESVPFYLSLVLNVKELYLAEPLSSATEGSFELNYTISNKGTHTYSMFLSVSSKINFKR